MLGDWKQVVRDSDQKMQWSSRQHTSLLVRIPIRTGLACVRAMYGEVDIMVTAHWVTGCDMGMLPGIYPRCGRCYAWPLLVTCLSGPLLGAARAALHRVSQLYRCDDHSYGVLELKCAVDAKHGVYPEWGGRRC